MNRCEFSPTEVAGAYRCRRCGAVRSSPHPAERIHRWCDAIELSHERESPAPPRGLGDTIARAIDAVTWGQAQRLAAAAARLLGRNDCGCDGRRAWLNRAVPYRPADKLLAGQAELTLLLRMPHGLGDAVQMTVVLQHLRHYRPHWIVDVAANRGAETLFTGLCRRAYLLGEEPPDAEYTVARTLAWDEPDACYADSPATKAERCLREVFQFEPLESLCRYQIHIGQAARDRARHYLATLASPRQGRYPVVLFHYQGNSAVQQKTLDEELVGRLVRRARQRGLVPVVLDWDRRSRLPSLAGAHRPDADHPLWQASGTGDGETLAALIDQSAAMLAIDSGPGHIAGATQTPTLVVWSGHHPLHFYGLAPRVRHAVPSDHADKLRGALPEALAYFERSYDYRSYLDPRRALPMLFDELIDEADDTLPAEQTAWTLDSDLWIRRAHRQADRTIVRDVYVEDCYGVDRIPRQPRFVVDVGAHIGAFARRIERRLAAEGRLVCVEADPANLPALRKNVSDCAQIVAAACTYAPGPIHLRSTVVPGTDNTGGSSIDKRGQMVPTVTLEKIIERFQLPWIDVLKLDCEGCELSLLQSATVLDRVRLIVGEWHDRARFLTIIAQRCPGWRLRVLREGPLGLFWLENPHFAPTDGVADRPTSQSAQPGSTAMR